MSSRTPRNVICKLDPWLLDPPQLNELPSADDVPGRRLPSHQGLKLVH
jgi:hypothetical protein